MDSRRLPVDRGPGDGLRDGSGGSAPDYHQFQGYSIKWEFSQVLLVSH